MTRRQKLQVALDSNINAAEVLRQYTADGGSGIDGAVEALYSASQAVSLTRRAKLQAALDAVSQEEVADAVRSFTTNGGSGIDGAVEAAFSLV